MKAEILLPLLLLHIKKVSSFLPPQPSLWIHGLFPGTKAEDAYRSISILRNTYDDWRSDVPVDTMPLEEEFVQMVLDEMIDSEEGEQMFGVRDRAGN